MDQQPDQDRSGSPDQDKLNSDLADAFSELIEQMMERFEALSQRFSLPPFCVKALHMLSSPMAMKELGQRFRCDPSYVTSIADMLDSHGLGRRETDTRDRRIKNLMLTPAGIKLRACIEQELIKIMPWTSALDAGEQETLLRLVRKMIKAAQCQQDGGQQYGGQQYEGQPHPGQPHPEQTSPLPCASDGGRSAGEVRQEPSPATPSGA